MRCPNCGGLNSESAKWCGQCLASFDASRSSPSREIAVGPDHVESLPAVDDQEVRPGWTCPACHATNPISLDVCTDCGTGIFDAIRSTSLAAPGVKGSPELALALSILPGVGHLYLKRVGEGVLRLLLGVWWLGTAVAIPSGSGVLTLLRILFLIAVAALALVSMLETYRQASEPRAEPILAGRPLLFWTLGMIGVLTVGLMLAAMGAAPQ